MTSIIVADDDMTIRESTQMLLEDAGFDCDVYSCGNDALAALKEHPETNLLMMDLRMPGGGGLEILEILRSEEQKFQQLPVILMSGNVSYELIEEYKNDTQCRFLSKPFRRKELLGTIDDFLQTDSINS